MMKKTQKRAFILNECNSPYIAQAIFVLKDGVDEQERGVLQDAERIVASYMGHSKCFKEKKAGRLSLIISACAAILTSLLALLVAYTI